MGLLILLHRPGHDTAYVLQSLLLENLSQLQATAQEATNNYHELLINSTPK